MARWDKIFSTILKRDSKPALQTDTDEHGTMAQGIKKGSVAQNKLATEKIENLPSRWKYDRKRK
jgi:hypothetical protein